MLIWILIIIAAVALDQLTKYLTILYLKPVDTVPLIRLFGREVLNLTYVENTGAAFGMMKDSRWLFMIVSTVAIIGVLVYMFVKRPKSKWVCLCLSFIVGGGIGNMIDRTMIGYVVDMIDFRLINFAVFNVADSFVTVGAGILMVVMLISIFKEAKEEKRAVKAAATGTVEMTETDTETDAEADTETDAEPEPEAEVDTTTPEEDDHA